MTFGNETAERGLVASVLQGLTGEDVINDLTPEGFTDPWLRKLWVAFQKLAAKRTRIDVAGIEGALKGDGAWPHFDGLTMLSSASDPIVYEHDIPVWVKIVRDQGRRIQARARLSELANAVVEAEDLDEVLSRAVLEVSEAAKSGVMSSKLRGIGESLAATMIDIEARASGKIVTVSTGFHALDEATGGLELGGQYVVGARPKSGKTAFALTLLKNAAEKGIPTLMFSLEMSEIQLTRRLFASALDINIKELRAPKSKATWERLVTQGPRLQHLPFHGYYGRASVHDVMREARRWASRQKAGPRLIVVDYLQLMDAPNGKGSREQEVSMMSRELKLLAGETKSSLILLSQLNRGLEQRDDKRPRMSDLRESGAIEQDADGIFLLHRPHLYNSSAPEDLCEVVLAAQREAETGTIVKLRFRAEYTRFEDMDQATGLKVVA